MAIIGHWEGEVLRASFLIIVASAAMGGCAAQQQQQVMHWAKPGATQQAFMQDRYACLHQTPQYAGGYDSPMFASCMGARGYKQDPNGDLFPPSAAFASPLTEAASSFMDGIAAEGSPQNAARKEYDRAVANYKACLDANPSNPNACDGQRNVMDAAAQVAAAPRVNQDVYVNH
jgi:hypothetical protein